MSAEDITSEDALSEDEVIAYLRKNPDFLKQHPDLLTILTPPEQKMGGNVVDFQKFALGSLQQDMQTLQERFDGLLVSARDNMSTQGQVHHVILQLLRARDLEQLFEVLTIDMAQQFDVDAVRLVIESDISELYEAYYSEEHYSGISFVPLQTVDLALGPKGKSLLIDDTHYDPPYGYDTIFVDCAGLIRSCALLRIHINRLDRSGLVAFGVREAGRFSPHQGVELLNFLSRVIELRLEQCLNEHEIERLI
ncbi:MAG: DUF484 family protein [Rickettsiales bacterium]|nr:DUF484 family protein [Rickettsiales bacterium]